MFEKPPLSNPETVPLHVYIDRDMPHFARRERIPVGQLAVEALTVFQRVRDHQRSGSTIVLMDNKGLLSYVISSIDHSSQGLPYGSTEINTDGRFPINIHITPALKEDVERFASEESLTVSTLLSHAYHTFKDIRLNHLSGGEAGIIHADGTMSTLIYFPPRGPLV